MKQWAKRQAQIESVMNSMAGMYGDLQEIAGKFPQKINDLERPIIGNETMTQNTLPSGDLREN